MANPFTTGPFVCCECPAPDDYDAETDDPLPTYVNLCDCPTIEIECESVEKTAELCGHIEYTSATQDPPIVASSPPKKYKVNTLVYSKNDFTRWTCCSGSAKLLDSTLITTEQIEVTEYSLPECEDETTVTQVGVRTINGYDCGSLESSDTTTIDKSDWDSGIDVKVLSTTQQEEVYYLSGDFIVGPCEGSQRQEEHNLRTNTLTAEDTEDDALDRATETEGTDCTSIYELRTTSFSFTHRTVKYTATASNLVKGVSYKGCIRLQRRKAYSGTIPDDDETGEPEVIEWEDVAPDEIAAFTASDTEEEVATEVDLPIEQGWEYQIAGAYIYPASSDCECPSTYVEPEE